MEEPEGIEPSPPACNAITDVIRSCRFRRCSAVRKPQSTDWWRQGGLNSRHPACKAGALPLSYVPVEVRNGKVFEHVERPGVWFAKNDNPVLSVRTLASRRNAREVRPLERIWWRQAGLNRRRPACKADALPLSYVPIKRCGTQRHPDM